MLLAPATTQAAITTFGSPLSVPATLNTAVNLSYPGTNTTVPPSAEAPTGVYHTYHYGADAALWSVAQASGLPRAPATGQAVKVSLEGCAQPAGDGLRAAHPDPLPVALPPCRVVAPRSTSPRSRSTSRSVDGTGLAARTVTTYEPINLCVSQGDYVDLNEEGGFVEHIYQNGVPYRVLGAVPGSTTNSFIKGNSTGNGATLSSSNTAAMDGFASNLQRGTDAAGAARHGTGRHAHLRRRYGAACRRSCRRSGWVPQTDGVNHHGIIVVAIYCRLPSGCNGVATLTPMGRQARKASYGHTSFSLRGNTTSHVPIRVTSRMIQLVRRYRAGVSATLTAVVRGKTVSQTIVLKIL